MVHGKYNETCIIVSLPLQKTFSYNISFNCMNIMQNIINGRCILAKQAQHSSKKL